MLTQGSSSYCRFRVKVYDNNNMVIGSTSALANLSEGESTLQSTYFLINKTNIAATSFYIKLEEE